MSTLNAPQKISKRQELREDQVVTLYARSWEFYDQNKQLVWGAVAALVVVVLLIIGYGIYRNSQAAEAGALLGTVVRTYESGNYEAALEGTGDAPGLLAIADEYGGTDAGNLAAFYAADALFKLGEYERALEYFEAFDAEPNFIGASAIAGEAAVYESLEQYERAADLYERAATFFPSEVLSPQYLLNAGRAYELAGDYEAAEEAYMLLKDEYPEANAAANVDTYLARARAEQANAS